MLARRRQESGFIPKGGGAQSFTLIEGGQSGGFRLQSSRIAELQDLFLGIGLQSLYMVDASAACGARVSPLHPDEEEPELIGAEKTCFGTARKIFRAVAKARTALHQAGRESAVVLHAAYGPAPRLYPPELGRFASEICRVVLFAKSVKAKRDRMVREAVEDRLARCGQAAKDASDATAGAESGVFYVSSPMHPAQRDVSIARIRRGAEMEFTTQMAIAEAMRLPPKATNDQIAEQRSFVVQVSKEASKLLGDASQAYHEAWMSVGDAS